MNSKVAKLESKSPLDIAKLVLAVIVLTSGTVSFYWFNNWPSALRIVTLLGAVAVAVLIANFTQLGRNLREFLTEANIELRKVVWPTRDETVRTTGVIIVVVIILSILIGLIDLGLKWVVLDTFLKPGGN